MLDLTGVTVFKRIRILTGVLSHLVFWMLKSVQEGEKDPEMRQFVFVSLTRALTVLLFLAQLKRLWQKPAWKLSKGSKREVLTFLWNIMEETLYT